MVIFHILWRANVAQSVEQLTRNEQVDRSIRFVGSIKTKTYDNLVGLFNFRLYVFYTLTFANLSYRQKREQVLPYSLYLALPHSAHELWAS